ncbi:hypothetical protein BJ994_003404 [Arthrobacter pigmenti]|uniref:Uncharacterized protein n=1 Tax=Arthrobacter pigmenti TaxID=271432 RepID=A0A846RLQ0_9MICC|nr:hypothetical protein [Arthrobacter pigmenti]NJC24328.1 hypothetical protein [Arthrobacter pigmenti]
MGKTARAVVVVLGLVLLTGCGTPGGLVGTPCPAIAWSNLLTVQLEGDALAVEEVQACVDGDCSVPAPRPVQQDTPPVEIPTPHPSGRSVETESAPGPSDKFTGQIISSTATRVEQNRWGINYDITAPEAVTVRALDAAGNVLAEDEFALDWVRTGGSEECGGPMEAGPVTLTLP